MSDNPSYQPRMMGFGVWTLSGCLMHWILVLCQYLLLQWLLCHLIDSLLSRLIEWMTLTLPKEEEEECGTSLRAIRENEGESGGIRLPKH